VLRDASIRSLSLNWGSQSAHEGAGSGTDGPRTLRWREQDSNPRSRCMERTSGAKSDLQEEKRRRRLIRRNKAVDRLVRRALDQPSRRLAREIDKLFGVARCEIKAGDMAGSIDRLTVGPRDPRRHCSFHRNAGIARHPAEWISPRGELQVIAQVTRLPRRSTWSTLHCASAGIGLAASMQAIRVIGALPPAA
jgi:hypothetical protein